jgi:hypothetical protein
MSRSELVHRLGYRDIGSGHKALSALLLRGLVARTWRIISPMLLKPTPPWSCP